jgi:polyisoprenoid-binding protein YceI
MMPRVLSRYGRLTPLFATILIACAAFGAGLSPSKAQEWRVNKGKSRVSLELSIDGQPVEARFGNFKIEIRFDPEEPGDGEISAILDAASVSTGDASRDAALASADWLNAAAHPAIRFNSSGIKEVDAGRYTMSGKLTIKGVSKTIAVPLTVDDPEGKIEAEVRFQGAAFGIGPASSGDGDMRIMLDLTATNPTN